MSGPQAPRFFATAVEFRRWLHGNHDRVEFLWVGFWKVGAGKEGLTYEEAVEEALCYGWIDGIVKRVDEHAYMHRFTRRRARSIWSAVNLRKVEALKAAGRMAPPGLAMFESRDPRRAGLYSFENKGTELDATLEKRFRARKRAWAFFERQPPGYRRVAIHWVMSARKPETRERRLAALVDDSSKGLRVASIAGPTPRSAASGPPPPSRRTRR